MLSLDGKGLIPAVIQEAATRQVLMVGYMNLESLKRTLDSGDVWFYSRSRIALWHKGELSGNYLRVHSVTKDCDGDALLIQVEAVGPCCHTGNTSCFFETIEELPEAKQSGGGPFILEDLFSVIQDRKINPSSNSYTSLLIERGPRYVAQKIIEEAGEAALAGASGQEDGLAEEIADLFYHALVLLAANEITPEHVWDVLRQRRHQKISQSGTKGEPQEGSGFLCGEKPGH